MGRETTHIRVQELLPWFVNETLEGRERALVLRHLQACRECRRERDYLQRLQQEVAGNSEPLPDYRFSYQKLMARIEATEKDSEYSDEGPVRIGMRRWLSLAGAAATVVFGVYFAALMQGTGTRMESADFRGLTLPAAEDGGPRHRIELTFEEGVEPETVRAVLIETHSRLAGGPDEKGTWVVDISVPADMTDAEFIRSMRNIDGIARAAFVDDGDKHEAQSEDTR